MLSLRHSIGIRPPGETLVRGSKSVPDSRCYASPPPTEICARSQWLVFQATYIWRQPVPSEEDTYSIERREIWYIINSYLVKRSGFEETLAWAQAQDFRTRPLAEPHELHDYMFFGELYWSPNYRSQHVRFQEYPERR